MKWAMAHGVAMHGHSGIGDERHVDARGFERPRPRPSCYGKSNAAVRNPYVRDRSAIIGRFIRPQAAASDGQCGTTPQAAVNALTLNGANATVDRAFGRASSSSGGVVNAERRYVYGRLQVDNTTMNVVALDGVPLRQRRRYARVDVGDALGACRPRAASNSSITGPSGGNDGVSAHELLRLRVRRASRCRPPFSRRSVSNAVRRRTKRSLHAERQPFRRRRRATVSLSFERVVALQDARGLRTRARSFIAIRTTINGVAYDPSRPADVLRAIAARPKSGRFRTTRVKCTPSISIRCTSSSRRLTV